MSCNKTDVFPTRIDAPSALKRLSRQPDFQTAVINFEIFPFIIYLDNDIIYYKKVDWNPRYQKHFLDTSAYIKTLSSYDEKPWDFAARKFRRDVGDNLRKNIDSRTCFKFEYNYFLVKTCFTFGQRKVQQGTKHLYQIGAVQMVLYFPNRRYRHRITKKDKIFPVEEQFWYEKRILQPNRCYIIPSDTIYILYAITKCYFSLNIVSSEAKVPFSCCNPLEEIPPPAADLIYRRPVPTPLIEEVVVDEEEDSASDPVLITLPTGEDVTESMLMPPPPPPLIPVKRTVQVVTPDTVQWYQKLFHYKLYNEPKEKITNNSINGYVLDLTVKKNPPPESPSKPVPPSSPVPITAPSPAPSPVPIAAPSPAPIAAPSPVPIAVPCPVPMAAPSPAPIPVPMAAPSPVISPAPIPFPMAAPSPVPIPAPIPVPMAAPSPAPIPVPMAAPSPAPQMYASIAVPTNTPITAPVYTASTTPVYTASANPAPSYEAISPAPSYEAFTSAPSYKAISPSLSNPAQPSSETISFEHFFNTLTPIEEQILKDFFGNDFCY